MNEAATRSWTIIPQGDRSLLLVLGDGIDVEVGQRCAAAAAALRQAALSGVTDVVPAFNSVAVHYQPRPSGAKAAFRQLADEIENVLGAALNTRHSPAQARQIEIPVCYGGEFGPDLAEVAAHCKLDADEVVRLHSGPTAYVFMLGFAPGAPYIGVHDPRLAIGRRATPRTALPAGSVAIANRQTMIYPNVSPGGWHIIGNTPSILFDPAKNPATLLSPGDTIRFVPISPDEYRALKQERP
ncbi:MAG: 5-oxoprolinase subunit PxpB [Burkholderiaceae bacterium]